MCGVAGMAVLGDACSVACVDAMCRALEHRGPDSGGVVVRQAGNLAVVLGARRLSIQDLSAAGDQPMHSLDGQVSLVYNGELYNGAELRRELVDRGYVFRSHGDTETVLNAYHAWGLQGLGRLEGMFALAVFDQRSSSLTVARDRMGIKPLYYHWDGRILRFASELKALLCEPTIERRLDREAVNLFLTFGYVPSPYTLLADVGKLRPGHALVLGESGLAQHAFSPWTSPRVATANGAANRPVDVRERVERAIGRQMVSDVSVGVLLSGGLDSSLVATVAAQHGQQPLHTFTAAYRADAAADEVAAYNEDSAVARRLADSLGTRHHEVVLDTRRDWSAELPRLTTQLDEPLFEPVYLVLDLLCAEARGQGVPVLLTGDGADELFHGYSGRYQMPARARKYGRLPGARHLAAAAAHVGPGRELRRQAAGVRRVLDAHTAAQRYLAYSEVFDMQERSRLLGAGSESMTHALLPERVVADAMSPAAGLGLAHQLAFTDLRLWVGEHFNPRLDRIAMMHSVEARVPFQDDQLVDHFVWTDPDANLSHGSGKYLLRRAFAEQLPEEVLTRPKRAFQAPGSTLMRHGMLRAVPELLARDRVLSAGALDPVATETVLRRALDTGQVRSFEVWTLIALQLWCEAFLSPGRVLSDA